MSPADFVPLREIGRGAHGAVHLARNPATGAFAALKVCPRPEGDAATPSALAAWERERLLPEIDDNDCAVGEAARLDLAVCREDAVVRHLAVTGCTSDG